MPGQGPQAAKLTFTALKHGLHLQSTNRGAPTVTDQVLPAPRLEAAAAENGSNVSILMYSSRQQRLVAVCSIQQQYLQAHASRAARVANSTWSMLERATSSACKLTRVTSDTITMNGDRAAFRLCTRRLLCLHEDACRLPSPSHLRILRSPYHTARAVLAQLYCGFQGPTARGQRQGTSCKRTHDADVAPLQVGRRSDLTLFVTKGQIRVSYGCRDSVTVPIGKVLRLNSHSLWEL